MISQRRVIRLVAQGLVERGHSLRIISKLVRCPADVVICGRVIRVYPKSLPVCFDSLRILFRVVVIKIAETKQHCRIIRLEPKRLVVGCDGFRISIQILVRITQLSEGRRIIGFEAHHLFERCNRVVILSSLVINPAELIISIRVGRVRAHSLLIRSHCFRVLFERAVRRAEAEIRIIIIRIETDGLPVCQYCLGEFSGLRQIVPLLDIIFRAHGRLAYWPARTRRAVSAGAPDSGTLDAGAPAGSLLRASGQILHFRTRALVTASADAAAPVLRLHAHRA